MSFVAKVVKWRSLCAKSHFFRGWTTGLNRGDLPGFFGSAESTTGQKREFKIIKSKRQTALSSCLEEKSASSSWPASETLVYSQPPIWQPTLVQSPFPVVYPDLKPKLLLLRSDVLHSKTGLAGCMTNQHLCDKLWRERSKRNLILSLKRGWKYKAINQHIFLP